MRADDLQAALAGLTIIGCAVIYARRRFELVGADVAIQTGNDAPMDQVAEPTIMETIAAAALGTVNSIAGTDAASMRTSAGGLAHLHAFERLALTPYELGDGGWTIGWGRYFPYNGPKPPDTITRQTADEWFAEDVDTKAERWVKAYVTVPLTQPQFDALVSMAYNLSPKSFRTIADQVNAGNDPEVAALKFVRAGSHLERGLRRRRAVEVAMYRADPGAYGTA